MDATLPLNDKEKRFIGNREKAIELARLSAYELERRINFENNKKRTIAA